MVRERSGLLKSVRETGAWWNHLGIEFWYVAVGRMPVRVLIFPNYSIVYSNHEFDQRGCETKPRVQARPRRDDYHYGSRGRSLHVEWVETRNHNNAYYPDD